MSIFRTLLGSSSSSQSYHNSDSSGSASRRPKSPKVSAFAILDDDTSGLGTVELLPRAYIADPAAKLTSSKSLPLSLASYVKATPAADTPKNMAMRGPRKKEEMQKLSELIIPKDKEKFISVAEARYLAGRSSKKSGSSSPDTKDMCNVPPMITARPIGERTSSSNSTVTSNRSSASLTVSDQAFPQRPVFPSRYSAGSLQGYPQRSSSADNKGYKLDHSNSSLPSSSLRSSFRPADLTGDKNFVEDLSSKLNNTLLTPPTSPIYGTKDTKSFRSQNSTSPASSHQSVTRNSPTSEKIVKYIASVMQPSAPFVFISDDEESINGLELISDLKVMIPVWKLLISSAVDSSINYEDIKMKNISTNTQIGINLMWWGYSICFPKKTLIAMETLSAQETVYCVQSTLTRLCSGLTSADRSGSLQYSAVAPFIPTIAAYTAYRWQYLREITTEDGCCISATWIIPTAVIARQV